MNLSKIECRNATAGLLFFCSPGLKILKQGEMPWYISSRLLRKPTSQDRYIGSPQPQPAVFVHGSCALHRGVLQHATALRLCERSFSWSGVTVIVRYRYENMHICSLLRPGMSTGTYWKHKRSLTLARMVRMGASVSARPEHDFCGDGRITVIRDCEAECLLWCYQRTNIRIVSAPGTHG